MSGPRTESDKRRMHRPLIFAGCGQCRRAGCMGEKWELGGMGAGGTGGRTRERESGREGERERVQPVGGLYVIRWLGGRGQNYLFGSMV